jgi:ribosomal protein S18 acetylase RimI-like enzyme
MPGLRRIWLELLHMHESQDPSFALAKDGVQKWQQMAEDMLDREDTFVLAATDARDLLGFCLGWVARNPPIYRVSEVGFISEIAVARAAQRRGVGSALIAEARRWFKARGLQEFQLSTAVWNSPAQSFWSAVGGHPLLVRYRFDV